jgi:hypothetical protein
VARKSFSLILGIEGIVSPLPLSFPITIPSLDSSFLSLVYDSKLSAEKLPNVLLILLVMGSSTLSSLDVVENRVLFPFPIVCVYSSSILSTNAASWL